MQKVGEKKRVLKKLHEKWMAENKYEKVITFSLIVILILTIPTIIGLHGAFLFAFIVIFSLSHIFLDIKNRKKIHAENWIFDSIIIICAVIILSNFTRQSQATMITSISILILAVISLTILRHWRNLFSNKQNRIITTAISYLILSILFILIFAGIYMAQGDLQLNGQALNSSFEDYLFDNFYFSTVTFTSLGYGDITPVDSARITATIESLLGMFWNVFIVGIIFYRANAKEELQKKY